MTIESRGSSSLKMMYFGLFAILAVPGFLSSVPVEALVPSRQDRRSQPVPAGPVVPQQQPNLFFAQQQKRDLPFARAATTFGATAPSYTDTTSQQTTIQDLFFFTNQERQRQNLGELRYNKELERAAHRHAADMAKNNYFSHDGLDGTDLKDRVAMTDYRYTNVGENLFWRTPDNDPSYAVQGWMESPSHRKNMLDSQFSEIGLGYAVDEANAKHYYVQVFGRPLDSPNVRSPQETHDIIFRSTNDARQLQGLPVFAMSDELCQGAQEHADDMLRNGQLSTKLKRGSFDRFFTNVGARFASRDVFNDPHGAIQGWLEKGPQSDILSERYSETGIGYATDGDQHFYVQLFGSPMETGVGRRDFTRAGAPPRGISNSPGMGGASNNNQQQPKKFDKARNGDFGRMGFGQLNRERRQDSDEVDDQWTDERKVLAHVQNRRSPMRSGDMRRNGGEILRPMKSDGFDNNWNKDYEGTANLRNYGIGPQPGTMRRRSRSMSPGGGSAGPPSQSTVPLRSQQDMMNPRDGMGAEQFDRPPGMYGGGMMDPYDMDRNGGMMGGRMDMRDPRGMERNGMMDRRDMNRIGMIDRNGMMKRGGFNGMMDRRNMDRNGMDRNGIMDRRSIDRNGIDRNGMMNRNGKGRNGMMDRNEMGRNGMMDRNEMGRNGVMDHNGMDRNGMMGRNRRRQTRRASASPFGQPTNRASQQDGLQNSVKDIHFQRHEQRRMEDEMMYGPPGMGGGGMYGDRGGMMGGNQMRDPRAYGRYDFGQPPQQSVGMPGGFGRGGYPRGQYNGRMMDPGLSFGWDGFNRMPPQPHGVRPDNFGP